jgi:undecaprenyl pyrophosphate phosphatase UppP
VVALLMAWGEKAGRLTKPLTRVSLADALLRYLQSNSLKIFIVYRIVAGVIVIGLALLWHLE